jgi:hypothetical protein
VRRLLTTRCTIGIELRIRVRALLSAYRAAFQIPLPYPILGQVVILKPRVNDGFSRSERTDQWVRYLGDSRLSLANRQAGEDLEIGLAGQEGVPLVLGQVATGGSAGDRQQILDI